jgi:hypothetical protein
VEEEFNERFRISRERSDREIKQRLTLGKETAPGCHRFGQSATDRGPPRYHVPDGDGAGGEDTAADGARNQAKRAPGANHQREMVHGPKIELRIDRS